MSRLAIRAVRNLENNPIKAIGNIKTKYLPDLYDMFGEVADPRDKRYITYSSRTMLGQLFFKNIVGITSMQAMTDAFNNENVVSNIYAAIGEETKEFLPHHVTENEFLEHLDPEEIKSILHSIAYKLIRRKTFDGAKVFNRWLVLVDATQTYSGSRKINENCLERHYGKDSDDETVNYHLDVLEAKLYIGNNRVVSLASEFIENSEEDRDRYRYMSADKIKQDCETKAFKRLAIKLKKMYPRMPIIILADSLYASEPVMEICESNRWEYIIRFKDGSIPSIAEEYSNIPEKKRVNHAEYINEIDYKGRKINVLKYYEDVIENGKSVHREFQWLTSMNITDKNAERLAETGRIRWKIENQGFNRQKNWSADITHACSHNINAFKNHYLIMQIADIVRQLYEWFFLEKNGIKKTYKKISSDLQFALTQQFVRLEDTQNAGANKAFC